MPLRSPSPKTANAKDRKPARGDRASAKCAAALGWPPIRSPNSPDIVDGQTHSPQIVPWRCGHRITIRVARSRFHDLEVIAAGISGARVGGHANVPKVILRKHGRSLDDDTGLQDPVTDTDTDERPFLAECYAEPQRDAEPCDAELVRRRGAADTACDAARTTAPCLTA